MPAKLAAAFVGLAAGLCFWLCSFLVVAGGSTYSLLRLVEDTFVDLNLMSAGLVTWAVTLFGGLLLRDKLPRIAVAFAVIAPICGIIAAASEIWPLQQGIASLDFPEGEAIWIYIPRLTAALLALAVTLLGLSIQLIFAPGRLR
jgi:hypothetical protein